MCIDQTSNVGENTKRILDKRVKMLKILVKSEQNAKNTKNKAQSATEDVTRRQSRQRKMSRDNTLNTEASGC